jgi:carboxyl-terminal processing protease
MKRRLIYGLVTALLALNLILGERVYLTSAHAEEQKDSEYPNVELFEQVLDKIRGEYVDGTNMTYHDLVYSGIKGMVSSLDPHSEFLDPADYQELQDDTEGQFGGLGLVVSLKDGYVTVVSPMDDSPGFEAGILPDDRIMKINGKVVADLPVDERLDDSVKMLRGDPGSKVLVTIARPSNGLLKDFTLKRSIIVVNMVKDIDGQKAFPLGPDKIGYVRIAEFGDNTGDELQAALDKLKTEGMKGLIIDLRDNPGGLLDEAVEVSQKFLPRGQLVVSTEGRDPRENSFLRAEGHGDQLKGAPIVILVNLGTASAAEIVTGCLQDLHRAVVLGEKTFGKGSVQSIYPFPDGSALKLTTAKYYTPSHRVIHEHGIMPDIVVPMTDEQEAALILKRAPGGLDSLDSTNRLQAEQINDTQLDRAQDLLKGILIFSGMSNPGKMAAK